MQVDISSRYSLSQPPRSSRSVSSASGVVALLKEPSPDVRVFALRALNRLADEHWSEIAEEVHSLMAIQEDESASAETRYLAALVASKVCYHLGSLDEALRYALDAEAAFDLDERSEYTETILGKCIDEYVRLRQIKYAVDSGELSVPVPRIDPRLEEILERLIVSAINVDQYQQALGVALDSRRMDWVVNVLQNGMLFDASVASMPPPGVVDRAAYSASYMLREGILSQCLRLITSSHVGPKFRSEMLRSLIGLYNTQDPRDYFGMARCYAFLDDYESLGSLLHGLVTSDESLPPTPTSSLTPCSQQQHQQRHANPFISGVDVAPSSAPGSNANQLIAFQVAFDLFEYAPQRLIRSVSDAVSRKQEKIMQPARERRARALEKQALKPGESMDATSSSNGPEITGSGNELVDQLLDILGGRVSVELYLDFLYRNSHSDPLLIRKIKESVPERNSILHNSVVICNALMHAGTSVDKFWKDNTDWLKKSVNWAKFTATASLGAIHRGQIKRSRDVLADYLPEDNVFGRDEFSEGGALYALGLIHSQQGAEQIPFILDAMSSAQANFTIQHGGSLALGLCGIGSCDMTVVERLWELLRLDDAVAGEAAAVAMGLVLMGSPHTSTLADMFRQAQETKHEKITRGLALGMALILYSVEDAADVWLDQLLCDQDPLLRYGGMFTLGLAYAGTSSNKAVRKLLHYAVADVSDDVRRAAALNLGFVMCMDPQQCPRVVRNLSESYNPHVRYGAALAAGIACAGSASPSAISLVEPLLKDGSAFVRQGASMAMAMLYMQANEKSSPKVVQFREHLMETIKDKHEEVMARFGSVLAHGILDAGGRNVTIGLHSEGHIRMRPIAGMAIFLQHWFWYPFSHFISLSFKPTALIGLNEKLEMPKFRFVSDAAPSLFAYPPFMKPEEKKKKQEVIKAILSTSAKASKREKKKALEKALREGTSEVAENSMEVDEASSSVPKDDSTDVKAEEVEEEEKSSEELENPARVTFTQQPHVRFLSTERFQPVRYDHTMGIVLLIDSEPGADVEILTPAPFDQEGFFNDEPAPPEPFSWP